MPKRTSSQAHAGGIEPGLPIGLGGSRRSLAGIDIMCAIGEQPSGASPRQLLISPLSSVGRSDHPALAAPAVGTPRASMNCETVVGKLKRITVIELQNAPTRLYRDPYPGVRCSRFAAHCNFDAIHHNEKLVSNFFDRELSLIAAARR
jgi:hypothetical protein